MIFTTRSLAYKFSLLSFSLPSPIHHVSTSHYTCNGLPDTVNPVVYTLPCLVGSWASSELVVWQLVVRFCAFLHVANNASVTLSSQNSVKSYYMGTIVYYENNNINGALNQCLTERKKVKMSVKAYMDSRRHLIPWFSCPQNQKLPALGNVGHTLKSVSVSASRLNLHHQHQDCSRSSSTAAPTPVSACFPALNNNSNSTNNNNVLDTSPSLQRLDPHGRRLPLTPAGKYMLTYFYVFTKVLQYIGVEYFTMMLLIVAYRNTIFFARKFSHHKRDKIVSNYRL